MISIASLDASAFAAMGTLALAIVGAAIGWHKVKPEAESIATKTTLEVNESLREERREAREEAAELRRALRERDEEISLLQLKVTAMRQTVEGLEAEVNALRSKTTEARNALEKS